MKILIEEEGKEIDKKKLSNDLMNVLRDAKLSPAHSIFVQQQIKMSQYSKRSSMKWHPAIIRLAISLFETSRSAYERLRDSGFVQLPSSRTLFDYTHFTDIKGGFDLVAIESVIYKKASGELIGFTNLNYVDKELQKLDIFLFDPRGEVKEEQATKIMAFLVKGVANGVEEVVASFAVNNVSARQMYQWTWRLVSILERSDVPHLLRTLRNSFYRSRMGKKGKRCMLKNGRRIVWDHIVKLYKVKKNKILRKSYKLTLQHVYPDSYSCMKVKLAAQVLSSTVAKDLSYQKWPGTSETVKFIEKCNNWFDDMNGPHSSVGKKKLNKGLEQYRSTDD
ncbi:Transposable element P transposase [Frankliniella fusca]|uniref:Transposable element P transposase n=1 Tax=Frankliniella fusca TaxID=407009 RepID=A0AAE1LJ04_9NEOP|nr:Transposable element P transposase [Frankliniella fusca]